MYAFAGCYSPFFYIASYIIIRSCSLVWLLAAFNSEELNDVYSSGFEKLDIFWIYYIIYIYIYIQYILYIFIYNSAQGSETGSPFSSLTLI